MKSLVAGAPCKVNLSLDVIGTREDGYHLLRSVMQTVDLYDYLLIGPGILPGIVVRCDREQLSCDTTNTAYRAAEGFFAAIGERTPSVDIQIIKNIPMQAGLGGGSSDAAAALVGLNAATGAGLSQKELCEIGVQVGADVPFCIRGGTALCEGIGDIFTDLPSIPECFIVIARPEEGISTLNSFRRFDIHGSSIHPDTESLLATIVSGNLSDMAALMQNSLEAVSMLPQIQQYKQTMLECGAQGAVMTGSGSAVIGVFQNKRTAKRAHHRLLSMASSVFITRPVNEGARVSG